MDTMDDFRIISSPHSDVIILLDGTEIRPGDFCYILWNTPHKPSRWLRAKLLHLHKGTGNSAGLYEILKTGAKVSRGRHMVKSVYRQ